MIFLDIETIPNEKVFGTELWEKKKEKSAQYGNPITDDDAGLFPAFGKVCCIVASYKTKDSEFITFSKVDEDEDALLSSFCNWWEQDLPQNWAKETLCAHNLKGFDLPFMAIRFLQNGINLLPPFKVAGKKPWEINHVDTLDLLKFGSYQSGMSISLDQACFFLDVPSPKDGIDGSQVWQAWQDGRKEEILEYCQKDVQALYQVWRKLKSLGAAN